MTDANPGASRRYDRDSIEFGRLANLSDGVFAIALTLLVLDLVVPDVAGDELAGALRELGPNLLAFLLAFGLVANIWWLHHRVFAQLDAIEPGMIAINLAGLAGVAMVPFPTSLVGQHPSEQAAVLPFIGLFLVLSASWLLFVVRAQRVSAWRRPLDETTFRWLVVDWVASLGVIAVALLIGFVYPVAALVVLTAGSMVATAVPSRLGPARGDWF